MPIVKNYFFVIYLSFLTWPTKIGAFVACPNYEIFQPESLSQNEFVSVEADKSSVKNKNIFEMSGSVSLLSSEYFLAADEIVVNKTNNTSLSKGNVKFNDNDLLLLSDSLLISKNDNINNFEASSSIFSLPKQKMRGTAKKLKGYDKVKDFYDANYTRCPIKNNGWSINADEITLNSITNRGNAKNAFLNFHDIPIGFIPSFEWVLEGKGSGFLAPNISKYSDVDTTKKGISINVPYFFNIAKDRDLLIGANLLSTRGILLNSKYRELIYPVGRFNDGILQSELSFMPDDDITSNNRWRIKNNLTLSNKTSGNSSLFELNLDRVSDKNYFRDIALEGVSRDSIYSNLNFESDSEDFSYKFFAENQQIVNLGSYAYTKAPELSLLKKIVLDDNTLLTFSNSTTRFHNKDNSLTNGNRNHLSINLNKKYEDLAYEFSPSLTLLNTNYNLSNSENQQRSIYGLQVGSKLFLEREFSLGGKNIVQTLTPNIVYSYVPKKDQNLIPNFDTSPSGASYSALFDINTFTGFDKISNQNSITFGVESEFFDDDSGTTYGILKAAQKFYLEDELLNNDGLFEKTTDSDRGYSNISAGVELNFQDTTFENTITYNPSNNKTVGSNTQVKYSYNDDNFISSNYINDNNKESLVLSGSKEIGFNNHIFWNLNRNLTDKINDKATLGVGHEDCCLSYRFVFFKEFDSYDRVFEIVFKGLSSTSPSLQRKLKKEIPGYLNNLNFDYLD